MSLKNYPLAVTTSLVTIYTCPASLEASIHGLVISNITSSDATVNITYYKSTAATTYNLGTSITVSANKTFSWPRPINMTAGDYVQISASANSTLVADASVYEGSTVTTGLNIVGIWNSGTAYNANDVVQYGSGSWVAIQAGTNQTPSIGSSYWISLSQNGASGGGAAYAFSTTTTDADPGAGIYRFNNATIASVTQIFINTSDSNSNAVSAWLDSFDDSTNSIKGYVVIKSVSGANIAIFQVNGAVTSATGYRKIAVAYVAGALFSNTEATIFGFTRAGDIGNAGAAIALQYTFDTTTTDSDPGNGKLRLSSATQNASTVIRTDLLDSGATDWTAVLDTLDASTSTVKGQIRLVKLTDPTKWLTFNLTARATPSGYRNLTVTNTGSSAASPFSNNDSIVLIFTRTGDAGLNGNPAPKAFTILFPIVNDEATVFYNNTGATITFSEFEAVLRGSSTPSVTWTVRNASDRSTTGTEAVTGGTTTTSTTTGSIVSSFNSATVASGNWVWVKLTAVSGTVNEFHLSLKYS